MTLTLETFTAPDGTEMRYAKLVHSETPESGQPLVYVPGLGGSVKSALAFLEKLLPVCSPIISLDPRGVGINEHVAYQRHPAHYLDDFTPWVDAISEQGQWSQEEVVPHLMGLSLGGVITTRYIHKQQALKSSARQPFKHHILVAPAFKPHPDMFPLSYKMKTYAGVLTKGLNAFTTLPYDIHQITQNPERHADPHFQAPITLPTLYLYLIEQLCKQSYKAAQRVSIPSTTLVPGQDLICCADSMRRAHDAIEHDDKVILTFPEAYHDLMIEPEPIQQDVALQLTQRLQGFVAKSRQQPELSLGAY